MTATQYLVTFSSAALGLLCIPLLADSYRRTGELLSPWTMFLGMAIVDIYLPAAMFFSIGLDLPPWLSLLARDVVMPAVLVFTASAVFFALGYRTGGRFAPLAPARSREWAPAKGRTILVGLVVLGLYWSTVVSDVLAAGGVGSYLAARLSYRTAVTVQQPPLLSLIASLRGMLLPILFATAGVCFSQRHSWRALAIVFPLLAAATATTTLLRGSLLTLFIGLAIVERARLYDLEMAGVQDARYVRRTDRRIIAACVLGAALFVGYGTVRNYLTEQADLGEGNLSRSATKEVSRFVRGEGFIGLVAVLDAYPRDVDFMKGRTFRDMLLLPVPRAIWPSKPLWYGIDDITRAMGWPTSTQSAVTMPGELYANFAGWGLPLMWIYGLLFALMRRYRFHSLWRFVYAFIVVPMMLPTFWMAFTGFVNQLAPVPFVVLAIWFMYPKARAEHRLVAPALA